MKKSIFNKAALISTGGIIGAVASGVSEAITQNCGFDSNLNGDDEFADKIAWACVRGVVTGGSSAVLLLLAETVEKKSLSAAASALTVFLGTAATTAIMCKIRSAEKERFSDYDSFDVCEEGFTDFNSLLRKKSKGENADTKSN